MASKRSILSIDQRAQRIAQTRAQRPLWAGLSLAKTKGKTLGRPVNQKQRAKLLRLRKVKLPVKDQARRLGISQAAVYAMRSRMEPSE